MKIGMKLKWLPMIIFVTAFFVRITYMHQAGEFSWFWEPHLDAAVYDTWAQSIAAGDILGKGAFVLGPGLPYFLSVIYLIFGHNIFAAYLGFLLIGSLNCVLIYYLGKKIFNWKTGLVAAMLSSFYGVLVVYDSSLLNVSLINLCNLLMLLSLLTGIKSRNMSYWFIAGIFLGLSILFRPNILVFLPFLILFLLLGKINIFSKDVIYGRSKTAMVVMTGVLLALTPVIVRNIYVTGEFILTTASGGVNFYLGNNRDANGVYKPSGFEYPHPEHQYEDFRLKASQITGRKLSNIQSSRFWTVATIRIIRSDFTGWMKLIMKKFMLFFNRVEIPTNINYRVLKGKSSFFTIPFFSFGFIAPCAFLGIILCIKRWNKTYTLLLIYTSSYALAALLIFVASEHRVPVVPVLILFAAHAFESIVKNIKKRNLKQLLSSMTLLIAFGYCVNRKPAVDMSYYDAASHYNFGVIYSEHGEYRKAKNEFLKALKIDKNCYSAHGGIANIYLVEEDYESAEKEFISSISIYPENSDTHCNLGNLYLAKGDYIKAIEQYIRAITIDLFHEEALNNLGYTYLLTGEYAKAQHLFDKLKKINPQLPQLYNNMGLLFEKTLKYDESINAYCQAIELDDSYVDPYINLIKIYRSLELLDKAEEVYRKAVNLKLKDHRSREKLSEIGL
ncbi:tetratricopeptide repeat protein [Elusimicrobiota bacterium]